MCADDAPAGVCGFVLCLGDAGLSAIARLDPALQNSVDLPLPRKDQAREIIIAHLDYYRVNGAEKGSVRPFTDGGIEALLKSKQKLHPRLMLSSAAKVVFQAAQDGKGMIDGETVDPLTRSRLMLRVFVAENSSGPRLIPARISARASPSCLIQHGKARAYPPGRRRRSTNVQSR